MIELYTCAPLDARVSAAACAQNRKRAKSACLAPCRTCPGVRALSEPLEADLSNVIPLERIENVSPQPRSRSRLLRYQQAERAKAAFQGETGG